MKESSCLKNGSQKRTTGSTEMNTSSSRSHAIFSIILKQQIVHDDNATSVVAENENDDDITTLVGKKTILPQRLVSKFHFVDLAGSERVSNITNYNVRNVEIKNKQQTIAEANTCDGR